MNRTLACAALTWSRGSEALAVKDINIDLMGLMLNHRISRSEAALALTAALASDQSYQGCLATSKATLEAAKGTGGLNPKMPTLLEHTSDANFAVVGDKSVWQTLLR